MIINSLLRVFLNTILLLCLPYSTASYSTNNSALVSLHDSSVTEIKSTIFTAIKMRHQLSFEYNGKIRIVNPYVIGDLGRAMKSSLHGYQVSGKSSSGNLPGWRNFHLNKIMHLKVLSTEFKGPDRGYNFPPKNYSNIYSKY